MTMKPLCFVLDSSAEDRTPRMLLQGPWQCRRTRGGRRFQRGYLDTLNWRLLKSGLYLVADRQDSGIQLRLIALRDNQTLLETTVNQLPVFISSPPAGELTTMLAPILGHRALVTHIQLTVTHRPMTVVDDRGDAVAYLQLEVSEPSDKEAYPDRLPKRIWFAPIEGYDKQNREIVNTLTRYGSPVSGAVPAVTGLITAMNIDIARFDAKPHIVIQAVDRCDTVVKRLLASFVSLMEANRPTIIADIDTECLHDLRVAARRSRSLLGQMRSVIAERQQHQAKTFFSRLSQATNRQRDLDVMLLNFDYYRSLLPERMRGQLDTVYACVVDQRRTALDASVRYLSSAEYRRFIRSWRKYLDATPPRHPNEANAAKTAMAMAAGRIWKTYKRVLAEGEAIDDGSPAKALHSLRKRCKTLRYLIEAFALLYPAGKIQRVLNVLKRLQDNLGEYQDLHVHSTLLAMIRRHLAEQGLLTEECDRALTRITRSMVREGAECRARFAKRFAAFSNEGHQRLFRHLFKP